MNKVFGIDLGTTYSCVAYIDEERRDPIIVKNSEGEDTTPSVVLIESPTNIVVGMEAKNSAKIEPEKTIQFIKRKMGAENDTVSICGEIYHATEVSAMILKKIVQDANDSLRQTGILSAGEAVKDVVITCPAYFGLSEREATKEAGKLAGLNVLDIINEPTAAAISYGASVSDKDETVLVYDLGGGTFDITIINIKSGNIQVVCTGGDDHLGGKDWDESFINYVVERYAEEYGVDLMDDSDTITELYGEVEKWKKSLTSREETNISVNGPEGRLREKITREKFEEITSNLIIRTKNLMDDVLTKSSEKGYPLSKIEKILLVGGSSRMPQVATMIRRDYGIVPSLQDPDYAVAKGAALYAKDANGFQVFLETEAQKVGSTVDEMKGNKRTAELQARFAALLGSSGGRIPRTVSNVLSRSYGLATIVDEEKKIFNMLMLNDPLPASVTESFYPFDDNQSGISIRIYESVSSEKYMEIGSKQPIAEAELLFNNQKVSKQTEIKISFELDNSGILHVIAEEQLYHSKLDTRIDLVGQMSDDDRKQAEDRMLAASIE